jgi:hypothetical protein
VEGALVVTSLDVACPRCWSAKDVSCHTDEDHQKDCKPHAARRAAALVFDVISKGNKSGGLLRFNICRALPDLTANKLSIILASLSGEGLIGYSFDELAQQPRIILKGTA